MDKHRENGNSAGDDPAREQPQPAADAEETSRKSPRECEKRAAHIVGHALVRVEMDRLQHRDGRGHTPSSPA